MFIGDKKYACATCIKGHRSSSCAHTDRPLIEVKKKGRPVTQCEHCRDLRKTKQVHIKCVCVARPDKSDDAAEENPRRKKAKTSPPAPTFPNGIVDAPPEAVVRTSARPRRDTYMSCNCDQTGDCRCASPASQPGQAGSPRDDDLMASLILAAEAKLSPTLSEPNALQRSSAPSSVPQQAYATAHYPAGGSCCNPSPSTSDPVQSSPAHPGPEASNNYSFPPLPQELDILKCCCGESCACPGCAEHRGIDALASSESCPTSCSSCFNCIVSTAPAIQDWIEATAAGLPEPPPSRKIALDPTNVTVYPPIVWQNEAAARAAGLVKVPALCCGGKCGCPPNACACLDDCCGCCAGCACPEHEAMPHYSGYQGTLRCNYQVSGERASCCDSKNSTPPPPEPSFFSTPSFAGGMSSGQGSSSSQASSLLSSYPSQYPSSSSYSGSYRRPSEHKQYYAPIPPPPPPMPARAGTPPDTPLPRVPFQPAPGAFTLGQPNPQLMTSSAALQPLYHQHSPMSVPSSVGYRERDPRQMLERVRG